jgi:hypothetical protein
MKENMSGLSEDRLRAQVMAGRDYGPRVQEMLDGPLAGTFHEVESGWPCPNALELRTEDGRMAKYEVDLKTGKATFCED